MIIKCNPEWENKIFSYIEHQYESCLYIYVDIKKYGLDSDEITVWVDYDAEEIHAVIMSYHTGMHIFSRQMDFNIISVLGVIQEVRPTAIFGTQNIISVIEKGLNNYRISYGFVKKMDRQKHVPYDSGRVSIANITDVYEMTRLLYNDPDMKATYEFDDLKKQLENRMQNKYGRSFIIKDRNKIIAQISTVAEIGSIVILSAVMTDQNYRGKGLFKEILDFIALNISELNNIYLYCYGNELDKFYDKNSFYTCQNWAKLVLS